MKKVIGILMIMLGLGLSVSFAGNLTERIDGNAVELKYHDVNSEHAQTMTREFQGGQPVLATVDYGEEIVFCLSDGIYVQFADGTGRRQIINEGGYSNLVYPAWSIDGAMIAFAAMSQDPRVVDLYVSNSDGSNPICILSLNTGYFQSAIWSISWSWDSQYIMFNHAYDDYQGNDYFVVCSIHRSGSGFTFIDDPLRSFSQYEPTYGSNRYAYISTGAFWDPTSRLQVSNLDGSNNQTWLDFQGTIAGFTHVCWKSPNSVYTIVRWWDAYPDREVLVRVDRINNQSFYTVLIYSDLNASLWSPTSSPDGRSLYMAEMTSSTSTLWLTEFDNQGNIISNNPKGTGFYPNWRRNIPQTSVEAEGGNANLPESFALDQNFPNPFNATTTIKYNLIKDNNVKLDIFDMLGRKLDTIVDCHQSAGEHQVTWNASNVASGTYLYKLTVGDETAVNKMVLIK